MRRLSLHIGAHKTGTTTLQATLHQNEALLHARGLGLVYVRPWPNVHTHLGYHSPGQIFPNGFVVRDPTAFADMLAQHPSDHVFASSENFSFIFQQSALDDLALALWQRFDRIDILVYLRRQDRQAVSHHQEGAKPDRPVEAALWGHGLNALPEPSALHQLYLNYDARLQLWENAFGQGSLFVRVFDRAALVQGDIVADVLDMIGIDHQGLVRVADRNVSLGKIQAKVGHLANAALADIAVTTRLLDAFAGSCARMLPTAHAARAFLAPYVEGNRRLNTRLQISCLRDLFWNDFDEYPATSSEDLNPADWANMLRIVIATLGHKRAAVDSLTADDLRKAALALEKTDAPAALNLVCAAHELRPHGPVINRLKVDLESRLSKPGGI